MQPSPALRQVVASAQARAAAVSHPKVTVYHLLAAILDDPAAREAVEQAGGSVSRLLALTSANLQHVSDPSRWERFVSGFVAGSGLVEASPFRRALAGASRHMRRVSKTEVGVIDVMVALFSDATVADVMRESGLTRQSLLRYHCHGLAASSLSETQVVPNTHSEVLIFNDHYTEMATVVQILEKAFGMSPAKAFKTMLRVHEDGVAAVGPYAGDEAARKLRLASQMATAREAPLRLQLRPVQG